MTNVLLVIHLMIAAALVGVVLLQKSEGGALGIGGGGGGGFLTGRGTANLLTRITAALAAGFFVTSLALTIIANRSVPTTSVFDNKPASSAPANTPTGVPLPNIGGQQGMGGQGMGGQGMGGMGGATAGAEAPKAAAPADPAPAPAAPRGGILDKLQGGQK